jgi:hypothetical protein
VTRFITRQDYSDLSRHHKIGNSFLTQLELLSNDFASLEIKQRKRKADYNFHPVTRLRCVKHMNSFTLIILCTVITLFVIGEDSVGACVLKGKY